jgi:hypothetical protein
MWRSRKAGGFRGFWFGEDNLEYVLDLNSVNRLLLYIRIYICNYESTPISTPK